MDFVYYNGTEDISLPIIGSMSIKKSSREVVFSDIEVNFTGYDINDLPIKLQEVQIKKDGVVVYYGYVDSFKLTRYDVKDKINKISFTLLSPLAMLARKTVTLTGLYTIEYIFSRIFAPLYSDGFTLKEYNVPSGNMTVKFIVKTIEETVNILSNKLNLWVYIDELKQIYVNSLDYQFGKTNKLELTEANYTDTDNIWYIEPSVTSVDYANIVNAKNVLVYMNSVSDSKYAEEDKDPISEYPLIAYNRIIKDGETVNFSYPIDTSISTIAKISEEVEFSMGYAIEINMDDGANLYQYQYSDGVLHNDFGFDEEFSDRDFILIRDQFFKNLIVGIKNNTDTDHKISRIQSETALVPSVMKFVNTREIEINKDRINTTGVVEKVIDLNNRWFTRQELIDYIRSILINNSNQTDSVRLAFKGSLVTDYSIGDKININLPDLFTVGNFVVVDTNYTNDATKTETLELNLRTANMFENYIDLFRKEIQEENDGQVDNIILSQLVEETIQEVYEVTE